MVGGRQGKETRGGGGKGMEKGVRWSRSDGVGQRRGRAAKVSEPFLRVTGWTTRKSQALT